MKIILFGGAFDPPHRGHQQVVKNILQKKIADELWYVPVGTHDFQKEMSSAEHRVAMLKLILQDNTRIEDCEINRPGVDHTYDTLNELSDLYPEHEFSFLIGSDNLEKFHLWGSYEKMLKRYKFYVYPRKNFPMKLLNNMIALKNFSEIDVSSTQIRSLVENGKSVEELVGLEMAEYIKKNNLYKK